MFYPVVTSVEQRKNLDSHEESNLRPLVKHEYRIVFSYFILNILLILLVIEFV